jgi:nicotinate-nucleotide adenylyltransferase
LHKKLFKETGLKRTGIFGGTFNPIHIAHLLCCEEIRENFALDNVIFIPSAIPPHKESTSIIDPDIRYEMVKLGISGNPFFEASDIELNSHGKSYSVDTIKKFLTIYQKGITLFFIIGLDAFLEIETWKEPRELIQLCHFIVMHRPGTSINDSLDKLPEFIKERIQFDIEKEDLLNYNNPEKNIMIVSVTGISLSSTLIRKKLSDGKSIKYLVPPEVEIFISQHDLYKGVFR